MISWGVIVDLIFSKFHPLGPLPHPVFPTSIVASAVAGIGEEVIFRLFFIPFWVWLISCVVFRRKWQKIVFWIVAVFSALVFSFGHLPSIIYLVGVDSVNEIPMALLAEIIILNSSLSILAAYYFRKFGFLAAVGIHFWTDIVWHVLWSLVV